MDRRAGLVALSLVGLACRPALPALPESDGHEVGVVAAPVEDHLLLYPSSDLEVLLGRELLLSDSGGWTITGVRAAGCEVVVHRSDDRYSRTYDAQIDRVASLSSEYRELLGLSAHYGDSVHAQVRIDNTMVLRADLRGSCGRYVIDSVRVGTGSRSLVRGAQRGGQVEGGTHVGTAAGGGEASVSIGGEIQWDDPEVYSFTYRDFGAADAFDVSISMPSEIRDGETLTPTVESTHDAWLVVFFLEESGRGEVLYPSNEVPELMARAGVAMELPALRPQLRSTAASRETLLVYAFRERSDFEQYRPTGAPAEGGKYAADLTEALAAIPLRRWAREAAGYVIVPGK